MLDYGVYFPTLKTNQSELRALANTTSTSLRGVVPIFELTRSRRTNADPAGSVGRRVEQLREIYSDDRFLVDLTTEDDFISPDMELLFDETNGYRNWTEFVARYVPEAATPCLQFIEGGSRENFVIQASQLLGRHQCVALRVSVGDPEAQEIVDMLFDTVSLDRVALVVNLGFLPQEPVAVPLALTERFVQRVLSNRVPGKLMFCGSSFPKSVGISPFGNDANGLFGSSELALFDGLVGSHANWNLAHADYASVHPLRYPTRGGTWIPRVDVPLFDQFAYERRRRNAGGYAIAAREIHRQYAEGLPACWGTEQIRLAANGTVPGASPSFWISVRINIWLTRTQQRLLTA